MTADPRGDAGDIFDREETQLLEHGADEALVTAIARRDRAALAAAYSRHASRVHGLAQTLCGPARAEEVTRGIFVHLWHNPQSCNGSLRSHLVVQTHRSAVDILRSDNTHAARQGTQDLQPEDEPRPRADARALLERAAMAGAITTLPDAERHPIALAYFGGHTYRDIARLLGLSEETVRSRIRSGLQRLRSSYDDGVRP